MSIEMLQNISAISYTGAVLFLLISIVLFFRLNILKIYGDLSGRIARKAIDDICKRNVSQFRHTAFLPVEENAAEESLVLQEMILVKELVYLGSTDFIE